MAAGYLACAGAGAGLAHSGEPRGDAGPFSLEVLDAGGGQLPTFEHRGRTYILGEQGERYRIRVHNRSGRRVEAVVSVDGRDAIEGRPARWSKRGYILDPWGSVTVEGFRTSLDDVATFRFSRVRDSYAARMGDARDVGVIGVAIFPEREVRIPLARPQRRYGAAAEPDTAGGGSGAGTRWDAAPRASAPAPSGSGDSLAEAESEGKRARAAERPGLGTEFGERRTSQVREVEFARARSHPDQVLAVRYNDRAGLVALGIDVDRPTWGRDDRDLRETAQPFADLRSRFSRPPAGWRRDEP